MIPPKEPRNSRRHSAARRVERAAILCFPAEPRAGQQPPPRCLCRYQLGDRCNLEHALELCHESLRRLTAASPPSSTPPRGLRWPSRARRQPYLGRTPQRRLAERPSSSPDAPAFQVVRERWHVSGGPAANGLLSQNTPEQVRDATPGVGLSLARPYSALASCSCSHPREGGQEAAVETMQGREENKSQALFRKKGEAKWLLAYAVEDSGRICQTCWIMLQAPVAAARGADLRQASR